MHKLNAQFDELRSAIEPATARKTEAKKADDPVREHLQSHDSFSEHHVATFLWIESHPQGHIDFTSELNAESHQGNSFVRLSKMMKWWWQYQWVKLSPSAEEHLRKPKGFWIEMMCGEFADLSKESYPEMIVALLENAFAEFESFRQTRVMPELADPGLPDQTIKTSMTDNEFSVFLDVLEQALIDARAGVGAKTEREAAQQWRKLFGDKFPLPTEESKSSSLLKAAVAPGGLSFPAKPLIPSKPAGFA